MAIGEPRGAPRDAVVSDDPGLKSAPELCSDASEEEKVMKSLFGAVASCVSVVMSCYTSW